MNESLRERDIKYLWHPCTDINNLEAMPFPIIERARGSTSTRWVAGRS